MLLPSCLGSELYCNSTNCNFTKRLLKLLISNDFHTSPLFKQNSILKSQFKIGFETISFWSCCWLNFHWLFMIFLMRFPVSLHCVLMLIGMIFLIIWLIFHGRISLNSELVLLPLNFVSGFRLKLMYISLIERIRSSLTHLHGFQLLPLVLKG